MQMLGYHNHNFFCDGQEELEKYVLESVNQGIKAIGFSSHAPFFFYNKWSINEENITKYINIIQKLTIKYSNSIQIFRSLEIDYLPNQIHSFAHFKKNYNLDYTIGSIHYVVHPISGKLLFIDGSQNIFYENLNEKFNGDIKYAVTCYFNQTKEMILTQSPDIIGHIDKISMNSQKYILQNNHYPYWYIEQIDSVLNTVASNDSIIELNLRGLIKGKWHTTFIDEQFLELCNEKDIKMVISTDAHHPKEVGAFYEHGLDLIKRSGIKYLMKRTNNGWETYDI